MNRQVLGYAAAAIYLGVTAVFAVAGGIELSGSADWIIGLGFPVLIAAVIGRWWAVFLALGYAIFAPIGIHLHPCEPGYHRGVGFIVCDTNDTYLAFVLGLPIQICLLMAGVGLRQLGDRLVMQMQPTEAGK